MDPTVKNPADNSSNAMTAYRGVEPERAAIMAKNIMTGDVVAVAPHTSAQDIARLLSKHGFSAVPVVDDRKIVGIVTEDDLLRREELGTGPKHCVVGSADPACVKSHGLCARDVMTPDVVIVAEEAPLAELAELMESRRIKCVPVARGGTLAGIVCRADIVRALAARPEGSHGPLVCDDDIVRFKVIETLMGMPGAGGWLTDVSVSKGVVALSGAVQDENVREPSRRAIEKIPCVIAVDDHRSVLQPY
jgi:CBS domain-containing protein